MAARFFLVQTYQNGENIPNDQKLYHTAIHYAKWPKNIPNDHNILQHFPFQGPPKVTEIKIFGLKTNHLATLILNNFANPIETHTNGRIRSSLKTIIDESRQNCFSDISPKGSQGDQMSL
jgi:hypothetical protein